MAYNASRVKVGPGTLYAAPLGSTEPSSVTAAWPVAWVELGYTDKGTDFDLTPTVTDIDVEEEYWPVAVSITAYKGMVTFALAEQTAQNFSLVLNSGLTPSAEEQGTNGDGSIWVEMPAIGLETQIMLGWDALPKGGLVGDPFARYIFRQCLQSGALKQTHQKGNNKVLYTASFSLIKPATTNPFRAIFPPALAS